MKPYILILPNEKVGTYRLVTSLVLIMNTAVFGFLMLAIHGDISLQLLFSGFLIGLFALILAWLKKRMSFLRQVKIEYALMALAIIWGLIGNYFAAVCSVCFGIMGFYNHRQFILKFSDAGIEYPSFPAKLIPWKEVEFVKLKDEVLTLELPDNKTIQSVIIPSEELELNEEAFNQYCSEQINKAKL